MKLPRYLTVSIVITASLVLWSWYAEKPAANKFTEQANKKTTVTSLATTSLINSDSFVDLFPNQSSSLMPDIGSRSQAEILLENQLSANDKKVTPPAFPFSLLGAWWDKGNRNLILALDNDLLLICDSCQGSGYIKVNSIIGNDWKLLAVKGNSLSFLWLPEMLEVDFPLDEMEYEPRFLQ